MWKWFMSLFGQTSESKGLSRAAEIDSIIAHYRRELHQERQLISAEAKSRMRYYNALTQMTEMLGDSR